MRAYSRLKNTWAIAILIKHIAIGLMAGIAAYQSFVLHPRMTRALPLQMRSEVTLDATPASRADRGMLRANIILSLIILLLTAIARTA